uniref:Uncharacterized protein n=1 Tax=viral metagenome TaxID=1070528 RepID=A0A6C0DZC1_9ZZZZ
MSAAAAVAVNVSPSKRVYEHFIRACKNAQREATILGKYFWVFSGCQGGGKSTLLKHLPEVCASKDDANHSEGIWGDFHPFLYKKGSTKIPDGTGVVFCELDNRPNGKEFDDFKAYLNRYPTTLFIVMGCTDRFYTPQKKLSKAGALFTDLNLKVGEGDVVFRELFQFDEAHEVGLVGRIVSRFSEDPDHLLSKAQIKSGKTPVQFAYEVVVEYRKQRGEVKLLSPELSDALREQLITGKSYGGMGWACLGKAINNPYFTLCPFPKKLEICGRRFAELKTPGGGFELVRHYLSETIPSESTPVFWGIEATPKEQGEFVKSVASALPRSFDTKRISMTKEALVGCFPDGAITPSQVDKKSVGALIHVTHLFGAKPPASFPEKITITGILVSETTGDIVAVAAEGHYQSDGKTLHHISVAKGDTPFEV